MLHREIVEGRTERSERATADKAARLECMKAKKAVNVDEAGPSNASADGATDDNNHADVLF
jgi:hypothetical protein